LKLKTAVELFITRTKDAVDASLPAGERTKDMKMTDAAA
jgi:hypothetical protein